MVEWVEWAEIVEVKEEMGDAHVPNETGPT